MINTQYLKLWHLIADVVQSVSEVGEATTCIKLAPS